MDIIRYYLWPNSTALKLSKQKYKYVAVKKISTTPFCIYVYIEMLDSGESDNMIKISGKMDKSNTYKGLAVVIFHSFIPRTFQTKHFFSSLLKYRKTKKIWFIWWNSWNKRMKYHKHTYMQFCFLLQR